MGRSVRLVERERARSLMGDRSSNEKGTDPKRDRLFKTTGTIKPKGEIDEEKDNVSYFYTSC